MRHFRSVRTLLGTSYILDEEVSCGHVSDITIDPDVPSFVNVWVRLDDGKEKAAVLIPFHAVELLTR